MGMFFLIVSFLVLCRPATKRSLKKNAVFWGDYRRISQKGFPVVKVNLVLMNVKVVGSNLTE